MRDSSKPSGNLRVGVAVCCDGNRLGRLGSERASERVFRGQWWWEGRAEFSSRCIKQGGHSHGSNMSKRIMGKVRKCDCYHGKCMFRFVCFLKELIFRE